MKILVIGGGASGLYFSILAARNSLDISIIEQGAELGKKILSTGNGRCNYTNKKQSIKEYYNNEKAYSIIEKYSADKTIDFFRSLGVEPLDREGYIYPYSEQAGQVRQALVSEIERLGVKVYLDTKIKCIDYLKDKKTYRVYTRENKKLDFETIIFASGSKAFPISGSDGSSLELLRNLQIEYREFSPALCPVYLEEKNFFKVATGVRTMAKASLIVENEFILDDYGQVQITDYGLSGIPIFQLSPKLSKALSERKNVHINIDFLPQVVDKINFLKSRLNIENIGYAKNLLRGVLNDKLSLAILKRAGIKENKLKEELSDKDIEVLAKLLESSKFKAIRMSGFEKAQVCTGGIPLENLSENLEYENNLFFIGEIVDVDAMCGGYNLQWAFSSAALVTDFLTNKKR